MLVIVPAESSLHFYESTDIPSRAQYVHGVSVREEFIFCEQLKATTKREDVSKLIDDFLRRVGPSWIVRCEWQWLAHPAWRIRHEVHMAHQAAKPKHRYYSLSYSSIPVDVVGSSTSAGSCAQRRC